MNQFEKKYSDNIRKNIDIPEVVMKKAEEAFGLIRNEKEIEKMKSKRLKKTIIGVGSAAAVMGAFICTCFMNTTWASSLPVIGGLFEKYDYAAVYKGNFTEMAEKQRQEAIKKHGVASFPCSREDGDITFTLKEMYCNDKAIYATVELKSKKGFSTSTVMRDSENNQPVIQVSYESLFSKDGSDAGGERLRGDFVDENTYNGILRIDTAYSGVNTDDDKVNMNLNFTEIRINQVDKGHDGAKVLNGNWKFNFDVNIDKTQTRTININTRNKDGVGIKSIDVTPYELILHDFYVEDFKKGKTPSYPFTFPVLLDANGKFVEPGMPHVENYAIYGIDVSKVDIYLCEYDEYLDELRGYRHSDKLKEIMEERALYHTTVEIPSLKK